MAAIQQFRTSMRGFNRQDVQDYIEQMTAAHKQEQAELQKKLDRAEDRIAGLEEQVSGISALTDESAKTQAALDSANQMVSRLRGDLSQSGSKLSVARQEIANLKQEAEKLQQQAAAHRKEAAGLRAKDEARQKEVASLQAQLATLQAQVAALEPMAAAYEELRDHAASVELEAHQKAQVAVSDAKAEAERIRAETRKWLRHVMEQYGELRGVLLEMTRQFQVIDDIPGKVETLDEEARKFREQGGLL